ncbi:MAG: glycosyltransferase family 4 protein [Promethearchaeota archaeon]
MRVLLVSLCFFKVPPRKGGGVDYHTYKLANALAELGCKVHYIVDVADGAIFHKNVVLRQAECPSLPLRVSFLSWIRNHFVANMFAFKSALSALIHESSDFDIIHAHGNLSNLLISLFKKNIPLVYTVHNPPPWLCAYPSSSERLIRIAAHKVVDEPCWRRANRIIALSKALKSGIMNWGIPAEQIDVIHNGADVDVFTPGLSYRNEVQKKFRLKNPYCLFVGQLTRRKGVNYLLRALVHSNINCVIVGEGHERKNLMLLAKGLGISNKVLFTGAVSFEDLRRLYAGASFFVFPSVAEGMPLTILEAMSSGLPVIATNIPGTDEVVRENYNGFLVPPRDVEALRSRIQVLTDNREFCKKMGDNARRLVMREFSWRSTAEKTVEVYQKMLDTGDT